eukprot:GHVO01046251.1.p1 GENE.GHVO01046251.1~~GHVO01046251.1.p1  ORF type:complete len:138 (-),score=26.58 GHVO01046251.1:306-662(-)
MADETMEVVYETLEGSDPINSGDAAKSIEGWIIIVTGVIGEAQEEDVYSAFEDFGEIKNLHLNLDRRTGYVKGYAFIEYGEFSEAKNAIATMNGRNLLESAIKVDWAFRKGPKKAGGQ